MYAGVTLLAHLFGIVLSAILLGAGYSIFPVDTRAQPFHSRGKGHAVNAHNEWVSTIESSSPSMLRDSLTDQPDRRVEDMPLELIYRNGNPLTRENLLAMQQVEDELRKSFDILLLCPCRKDPTTWGRVHVILPHYRPNHPYPVC